MYLLLISGEFLQLQSLVAIQNHLRAPCIHKQEKRLILHILDELHVRGSDNLLHVRSALRDPANVLIRQHLQTDVHVVFILKPELQNVKLKNTDNAGIHGNVYQWGRKDPFPGASRTGIGTVKEGTTSTFVTGFGAKDDEVFGSATMPYIVNSALTEGFTASKDITTVAESAKSPMHFGSDGANWASDIDVKALRLSTHGKAGLRALTRRRLTRPQERQPARRPTTTHAL